MLSFCAWGAARACASLGVGTILGSPGHGLNAKGWQRVKHRKEGKQHDNMQELQDEAARLGCEIWEVEEKKKAEEAKSEEDED